MTQTVHHFWRSRQISEASSDNSQSVISVWQKKFF